MSTQDRKTSVIILNEECLLDENLNILDKLFYAFFMSLQNEGHVINITNEELAKKIKTRSKESISIRMVQRSLKKLEDLGYITKFHDSKTRERIIVPAIKHNQIKEIKGN